MTRGNWLDENYFNVDFGQIQRNNNYYFPDDIQPTNQTPDKGFRDVQKESVKISDTTFTENHINPKVSTPNNNFGYSNAVIHQNGTKKDPFGMNASIDVKLRNSTESKVEQLEKDYKKVDMSILFGVVVGAGLLYYKLK